MKRFLIVLTIIALLAFPAYADVTIGGGVSSDTELAADPELAAIADLANGAGVLTNDGYGNFSYVAASSGDVSSSGDCTSGACGDGTSDGGGYYEFYHASGNFRLANNAGVAEFQGPAGSGFAAIKALSFTTVKTSGAAGDMAVYEANSTDTHAAGFRGPASITGDGAYRIQFPNARAAAANSILAVTNAGESGTGTAADPYIQTGSWVVPIVEGTASGGVIMGDTTPDAAGELGYASTQLSVHDGTASRSVLQVASTVITKSELIPIRYMEDDDTVAAPAATAEIGTTSMVARSFAEDADNGLVVFWHVPLDYSAGIKYRVYYAIDTNAGANETAAFSLAGCSVGNLDAIACSEGTAVVVTDELTADYDTGELIVSDWSTAVTVTDIAAGEIAKLLFIRDVSEDDMVGHALVTAIEIKYQAKVNASGDY